MNAAWTTAPDQTRPEGGLKGGMMRIGILGSGIVARTLASGFIKHGHQIMLGTRNPNQAETREWAAKKPAASVGRFAEAASFGDLLVLAVLGSVVERVIELAR